MKLTGRQKQVFGIIVGCLIGLYIFGYQLIWKWGVCRITVHPDELMVITQKLGGRPNKENKLLVSEGTRGVWEKVFGEGRYFFSPIKYQREKFKLQDLNMVIGPLEVGVVTAKVGTPLPPEEFLAEKGQKGIWKEPLRPGKYRLNPKGYVVEKAPANVIPAGYIGCVTALSGREPAGEFAKPGEKGIQEAVLNPGIYYLNPKAVKVDKVSIGYEVITLKEVNFPSSDGFPISLDLAVVWGIFPEDVPYLIKQFGNLAEIRMKIIEPQVTSHGMMEGSKLKAKEFIEGATREAFQRKLTEQLKASCEAKRVKIAIALVRHLTVPPQIMAPIQQAYIAVEEKLTKDEQQKTQEVLAELQILQADVEKGKKETEAETLKMEAELKADGERQVAAIKAQADVGVAKIRKEVADTEAQKIMKLGKANADVKEMTGKAQANRYEQLVKAFGEPTSYINYIFASELPSEWDITVRYAGPGTLWTDASELEEIAAKKILEASQSPATVLQKEETSKAE